MLLPKKIYALLLLDISFVLKTTQKSHRSQMWSNLIRSNLARETWSLLYNFLISFILFFLGYNWNYHNRKLISSFSSRDDIRDSICDGPRSMSLIRLQPQIYASLENTKIDERRKEVTESMEFNLDWSTLRRNRRLNSIMLFYVSFSLWILSQILT